MSEELVFVEFSKYCDICKYKDLPETKDPCNECLGVPARYGTEKPEKWEEKK